MPAGTVNQAYATSLFTGGTAPFDAGITVGTAPPGLTSATGLTLDGKPLQAGVFNFQTAATDFWGNQVQGTNTIRIVDVPTLTSVSPNLSGAGAGSLTITLNGSNFVNVLSVQGSSQPGSQAQWKVGNTLTPLATTFVNSGTLTAVVPSSLLAAPASAGIAVQQPSPASSGALPFSVLAPTISSISPTTVPAGSPTTTLTVSGANFVLNGSSGPTISLGGTPLNTTFVNAATLTAPVPAGMLTAPTQYTTQVANPGGVLSNTAVFTVSAAVSSIALTPSNSSPGLNSSVTYSVVLTSAATAPQGSVVIRDGNTAVCSIPAVTPTEQNSTGSCSVIYNNADAQHGLGVHSIIAFFTAANPANWTNVTSLPSIVTVSGAVTATSLISNQTTIAVGASVTFTATVQGTPANFGPPTGSVTFFDGGAAIPGCSGVAVSPSNPVVATCTRIYDGSVPILGPGTHQITAAFTHLGSFTDSTSNGVTLTVASTLAIVTNSLPPTIAGSIYNASLTGRGGFPPYTWSASGLPGTLFLNPSTGAITGTLLSGGTYSVTVTLRDSSGATVTAQFPFVVGPPPISISPSSNLPAGVVGVSYFGFIGANGGSGPYSFSLSGGSLPDGLSLSSGGSVTGTPKTPGQFSFTITATDAVGGNLAASFSITIQPPPLTITGGPTTTPVPTGTPVTITFTGTGGIPPYRYALCAALPPGMTFNNGVLSGAPTTTGTFTVCLTITDSTGATVTKNFTLTVTVPAAITLAGSLADGKVGIAYAGQITATGGTAPYTYSSSGLPDGLALSGSGAISGTPGTPGDFSFKVTATDSKGVTGGGTFHITVAAADLNIDTASLPDGTVGVAYSASLSASGGVKPYTWTVSGLPDGLTATSAGSITGTPKTAGKFTVVVSVTDAAGITLARRTAYTVTIVPAALTIMTTAAPNGTVGVAYTVSFAASGGVTPLTFSATGLPAGLTMSAAGVISGTPTAPGSSSIAVTVKDASGASISKNFAVSIALPAAPPLTFVGVSDTANPLQQPRLQVTLGNAFPVDVVVTLTMTFAADTGPDDPSIQFSSGGRTARITVPAGSTSGATDVGVQTGSVAGLITIVAQMQAAGLDVTPSPAPRRTIRIAAAAPVIVTGTITAVRNATGFTVTLTGYVTDREMTQAIFTFTAAPGGNLQTTTLTVPIDAMFVTYFGGSSAAAAGSQFTYTQPFTVTGSTQAVVSVTVTLVNKLGQSTPATATLN